MKNGEAKKDREIILLKTRIKKLETREVQYKKTEAFLENSQDKLKILFEFAPDAYYIHDLKGKFIDGNKAAEKILGYKRDELIGKSFLKLKILSMKDLAKAIKALTENVMGKGNRTG